MATYPPTINLLPAIFNPNEFYQEETGASNLTDVLIEGNAAGSLEINMSNNKIINCLNPTSAQDVATKNYVDTNDGGTLQQTLDLGNTATGANAKIGLTNNDVGYISSPQITLNNSRTDNGNTIGVPTTEYYKSGRNVVANDIVASQLYYAKNYAGAKTLFGKMECVATTTGLNNDDGALDFYSCVNGINNLVFRLNGADNENNSFRPLDMNGNALKTSQTNLAIEATASTGTGNISISAKGLASISSSQNNILLSTLSSSGTGQISIQPKTSSYVSIDGNMVSSANGTISLSTNPNNISTTLSQGRMDINDTTGTNKNGSYQVNEAYFTKEESGDNLASNYTITGAGMTRTNIISGFQYNLSLNNDSAQGGVLNWNNNDPTSTYPLIIDTNKSLDVKITDDFILTGANIEAITANASSGKYLRIKLNGTYYKLDLLAD
jgi:hypothetical protein